MLRELRIKNLGVILDASLELSPGLNVVTGETGAGKTMIVSGLGLLLGERADADRVRTGAKSALVEGFVELPQKSVLRDDFADDIDDGELILARSVSASGRSRAQIGGHSVPISVLSETGEHLVAVHGQADQWRLKRPEEHREVLDAYGADELASLRRSYRESFLKLKVLRAERRELVERAQERAQRLTLLEAGIARIDEVNPEVGEDEDLAAESERLTYAEDLLTASRGAVGALAGDESDPDLPNALALLGAAKASLETGAALDASLKPLIERVSEVATLLADAAADVASYSSALEMDPERLAAVHARRAAITSLQKAYGPEIEDVIAWRHAAGTEALDLAGSDDRLAAIDAQIDQLTPVVAKTALELHAARLKCAEKLGAAVTEELRHLAMGSARLVVEVEIAHADSGLDLGDGTFVKPNEHGIDNVTILMSANKGMEPRPVTKAASGGELSRVMLALEVVTSGGKIPTFIFDEVDAGVGGEAALDIGARLARLAQSAQVIVVTHLAQVAAFADNHLVVHKRDDGAVTESGISVVSGESRHEELARMLGGLTSSDVAREHASQLLKEAEAIKSS